MQAFVNHPFGARYLATKSSQHLPCAAWVPQAGIPAFPRFLSPFRVFGPKKARKTRKTGSAGGRSRGKKGGVRNSPVRVPGTCYVITTTVTTPQHLPCATWVPQAEIPTFPRFWSSLSAFLDFKKLGKPGKPAIQMVDRETNKQKRS